MYVDDIAVNLDVVRSKPGLCHMTAGVHPYHASELQEGPDSRLEDLTRSINQTLLDHPGAIVAFGELGLDFERTAHASKDVQIHAFKTQLGLIVSGGWDLPLFLHCRSAFSAFEEIIKPYVPKLPRGGLVHSFVGTTEQMQRLLEMGLDVSVNGFSLQDAESVEMVKNLPLDRLHLETDAPWGELKSTSELVVKYCKDAPPLPQSKKRDKWDTNLPVKERNESCMISRLAYIVAGLKGIPVEEVTEAAWRNSIRLFKLAATSSASD
jgi:TatD DNase family protein